MHAARHNVVHLCLAVLGAVMLAIAYVDWIGHFWTLLWSAP
jgi:hypothetical protein